MADFDKEAYAEQQKVRTKELTDKLESGMKDLLDSDKYKQYLKTMSNFHQYSSKNIMLIKIQNPDATRVASFNLWKEKFNRQVKKGEKGLYIYAPIGEKKPETKLFEKLDPDTGAPLHDKDGKIIMEELTTLGSGPRFKLVPVFDKAQTYGDPLPELVEDLTGNVAAIVHEIVHSRLHDKNNMTTDDKPKSKTVKEIESESIAYVVAQHFNIETAPNSFGYLAVYGKGDMSELKASLDVIRKEAGRLINAVEDRFFAICKERGIDLTAEKPEKPSPAPKKATEKTAEPEYATETRTENIAGVDFTFEEVKPVSPVKEKEAAATEKAETGDKTLDIALPDPSIGVSERDLYGYTQNDMCPLTADRALELFDTDHTIYMLYNDNTEAMAFDRDEIITFGSEGLLGITKADWENSLVYAAQRAIAAEPQETLYKETTPIPTVPEPDPEPQKPRDVPVYKQPPETARENGELDLYRESLKLNKECAAAIDTAIKESNYDPNHYDLKTAAKTVIETYGAERVSWVLANTIQKQHYDGRYSSANQSWAKAFDIPEKASGFFCSAHPILVNGFIDRVHEAEREKPSLLAALEKNEQKSKEQFSGQKPEQGKDAPSKSAKNKKGEEI